MLNFAPNTDARINGIWSYLGDSGVNGTFTHGVYADGTSYWNNWTNQTPGSWSGGWTRTGTPSVEELGLDGMDIFNDFYFSQDLDSKKDLENIASAIETEELIQYGLSTKTAKMVKTLAKTAGKRALTKREKDLFAKETNWNEF